MRAEQIRKIVEKNKEIVKFAEQTYPDIRNAFCADSMLTYDKIASFRDNERFIQIIEDAIKDLPEDEQLLYKGIM